MQNLRVGDEFINIPPTHRVIIDYLGGGECGFSVEHLVDGCCLKGQRSSEENVAYALYLFNWVRN
jgi:hypothetical protein